MPPPVLADSDDDGDDFVLQPDVTLGLGSEVAALDGTNEQSTGSTERLQAQIRSAQRGLFTASPNKPAHSPPVANSSASPAMRANKRRQTAAMGGTAASPEKRLKRTKTVTYSKKSGSVSLPRDEGDFAGLRQDGQAPSTSQSAKLVRHSGVNSSNGLPGGSVGVNFIAHEPNVMFRDTGSTAADNESSQQRMFERALRKGPSTSVAKLVDSEDQTSSSFPWSASGQTPSNRKAAPLNVGACPPDGGQAPTEDPHHDPSDIQVEPDGHLQLDPGSAEIQKEQPQGEQAATGERSWPEIFAALREDQKAGKAVIAPLISSSPRVEILVAPVEAMPEDEAASVPGGRSVQKPTRGRKRKAPDLATDPPNSDDAAIGLPKERYVPRPSRRRATQVAEEPIDYSVKPETVAKLKRTKTTAVANYKADASTFQQPKSKSTLADDAKAATFEKKMGNTVPDLSQDPVSDDQPALTEGQKAKEIAKPNDHPTETPPPLNVTTESPVKKQDDDEIFVKPAPKLKSTQRPRRSHTTIYEDHVEFSGSQRSPSLSQQQAKRKTALKSVENEAIQGKQRKRRTIMDDEDEDEIVLPTLKDDSNDANGVAKPPEHQPEESIKKRGRGRPSKASTGTNATSSEKVLIDSETEREDEHQVIDIDSPEALEKKGRGRQSTSSKSTKAKSAEKVPEDSGAEHEDEQDDDENEEVATKKKRGSRASKSATKKANSAEKVFEDSEAEPEDEHDDDEGEDEAPKKKGRGRPAKAPTRKKSNTKQQAAETADTPDITTNQKQTRTKVVDSSKPTATDPPKPSTPTLQAPTPSPEKRLAAEDVATPQKKVMPTSHSPIKSGSKVPLRVGLSKRQRIAPLLRMMKPPKR
ncbi:hypothetical protein LTR08_006941 [Meristemomyces frigidus]|nr:hypothetical protein LTR08_006941 [Meristemomyces frigidus]